MNRLTNEYLAGLFDGEGCVLIQKNKWSRDHKGNLKNTVYQIRVSIAVTNEEVINMLKTKFGGCKNVNKRINPKHHSCFCWIVCSQKAYYFLKDIHNLTIIKREQIKIALEFQDHIFECGRNSWNRNCKLSQEIINYRESVYQKLRNLKTQF